MNEGQAFLSRAIEQGRGLAEADIVLKGGRIFDLVAGELVKSDVAISSDRIVGTLGEYRGKREIDVGGKVEKVRAGETLRYRCDMPHRIRNLSEKPAHATMVCILKAAMMD